MEQEKAQGYTDEIRFQQRIAEAVRERFAGADRPASDLLADLLGVSKGVAYKRLQCKAYFTARELAILQSRLDIMISPEIVQTEPLLTFRAPLRLSTNRYDPQEYLRLMGEANRQLANLKSQDEQVTIKVSSSDLPIFYFFQSPILAAVKLYSFALAANRESSKTFELDHYLKEHQHDLSIAGEYANSFFKLSAVEIWSRTPVDNFLRQLVHLAELGILTKVDDLNRILDELSRVLGTLQQDLETGQRDVGATLSCFCNEKHYTNSVILLQYKQNSTLYITFDNPHFLTSQQSDATSYFNAYFQFLLRVSDPISRLGQLSAHRFISDQRGRIARARRKATLIIQAAATTLDGK